MSEKIDPEFIIEVSELLNQVEDAIIEIEQGKDFHNHFKNLMRTLHTLKGGFGMYGLGELEHACHHFETLIKGCADKSLFTLNLADYLLQGTDHLKRSITHSANFTFQLIELDKINSSTIIAQKTVASPLQGNVSKSKYFGEVFVVDDEESIREIITDLLSEENIKSIEFDNAINALDKVKQSQPDLIITDLKMPKMNGMEFISRLREEKINVPVIIVSGHVTKENCIEALSHGAAGIIEKPFNSKDLLAMAKINIIKHRSYKLLNQSIRHMQFQFSDLISFLDEMGRHDIKEMLQEELKEIMVQKRKLDKLQF